MRALVQRVDWAEVEVEGRVVGRIDRGLLIYTYVAEEDTEADAEGLAEKILQLPLFENEGQEPKATCQDVQGEVLPILVDTRECQGNELRTSAGLEHAQQVHDAFYVALGQRVPAERVPTLGNKMVRSAAAGPVNVLVEVPKKA